MDSLRKCVAGVKAVIHCAGPNNSDCNTHFEKELAASIKAAENIALSCSNQSISLLINFSTFHVYEHKNVKVYDESSNINYTNRYGLTNYLTELALEKGVHSGVCKVFNLRLTNVVASPLNVSSDKPMLLVPDICRQSVISGKIKLNSNENVFRDYLPISFLSAIVSKILSGDFTMKYYFTTFNLSGGNVLNLKEIAHIVAKEFKNLYGHDVEVSENFSEKVHNRFLIASNLMCYGQPTMTLLKKDIGNILKFFKENS